MNNDLISRSELTKELRERLVACNEWEEKAKDKETRIRANAVKTFICEMFLLLKEFPTVEPEPISGIQEKALKVVETLTEEHAINVIEEGYLRRGILFDGKSAKGEWICLDGEGLKKSRRGKYVIYDVDFLLDNLAREVNIMESARQMKAGKGNDND